MHGLAFAAILGDLDLSRTSLVTTLLGFNLGIELTQLFVVALVMPSLLLLSRTPVYPILRVSAAALGAVLAAGWLAHRIGLLSLNPVPCGLVTDPRSALYPHGSVPAPSGWAPPLGEGGAQVPAPSLGAASSRCPGMDDPWEDLLVGGRASPGWAAGVSWDFTMRGAPRALVRAQGSMRARSRRCR